MKIDLIRCIIEYCLLIHISALNLSAAQHSGTRSQVFRSLSFLKYFLEEWKTDFFEFWNKVIFYIFFKRRDCFVTLILNLKITDEIIKQLCNCLTHWHSSCIIHLLFISVKDFSWVYQSGNLKLTYIFGSSSRDYHHERRLEYW